MAGAAIGLTDAKIKGLRPPKSGQVEFPDKVVPGLRLRMGTSGAATFILRKRIGGRLCNLTVGRFHETAFPLAKARGKARTIISDIEAGLDPRERAEPGAEGRAPAETFRAVSETFIARHVEKNAHRSAAETKRIFRTYIWPEWGDQPFADIRRRAVTELLDKIEDRRAGERGDLGGPVQADRALAALSKLFTWYASRDDDYTSPIVRGMSRTKPSERARERVIGMTAKGEANDDELRLFWRTAAGAGQYGAFLQACLLTGQRRAKVMTMRRDAITDVGGWAIDAEAREKTNAGLLDLPDMALDIIRAQPEIEGNPYVFAGRGSAPMYPGDKLKKDFEAELAKGNSGEPLPHWTIHDLRRTAKTLMRRAGVDKDVSERVMGHAIAGVEGVYDRHSYRAEKADALRKLAGLLQVILSGAGNVVPMRAGK